MRRLHPGASGSPDDAKHESARESVRQRQLRELYEDTETGGDIRQRLPRFGTPDRERREIHRTLLQSMPFAFSARLPPTGRVRRRIRTATRRGEFGGLDTNLCPRPIVSEFTGVCQCANKTVSLGGSPPGFASRCVRTVPKPYPFEPLGLALERKADSPCYWKG